MTGSVLVAAGMILFARMDLATAQSYVAVGMIVAGLGMGLLQPVYTVAVQNVAPRSQMGAVTSSTIFFRSIGSTVGVAVFGSIMLTRYHADFASAVPAYLPAGLLPYFSNPLLAVQMQPEIEASFGRTPGGLAVVQALFAAVRVSLSHGLRAGVLLERRDHDRRGARAPGAAERAATDAHGGTGPANALAKVAALLFRAELSQQRRGGGSIVRQGEVTDRHLRSRRLGSGNAERCQATLVLLLEQRAVVDQQLHDGVRGQP